MDDQQRLEARVAELEVQLTLQQDEQNKLSEVLWRQQRQIDGLLARLKLLETRRSIGDDRPSASTDEVPPHY